MSVYTMGAVPRTLNLRRKPSSASRTSSAVRAVTRPAGSSNTGLPGALAPPITTLNLRKKPAPPAPGLNKRRLPGATAAPAPAPPSGSGIASDPGWYDDGGDAETFVPAPSGGGGGGGFVVPASDVRPSPSEPTAPPSDGIPLWAAVGGIALCAAIGFVLLHRQGIV